MKINITAGDCLNNILKTINKEEKFIPFREAMIKGKYTSKLFSNEFINERALVHNTTIEDYTEKIQVFLDFLKDIEMYNEVILWFGNDDFCKENIKIVLKTLNEYKYKNRLILNIVVEETGKILDSEIIQ